MAPAAALTVRDLVKTYGKTRAVDGVSLTVERGEVYGLLGPNGSGKTTTISCALGLLTHEAGSIEVLGRPAARIHETAGRVAVVFDGATLVDGLSCRQNLQYARRLLGHAGGRDDAEVLALTGISELADRRASGLSLGQRRRLSIARALVGKSELLVFDEPLSGLDTVGVRSMLALFGRLRDEGLTLVVSSHRLHEMETIITRVAILVAGRKLAEAPLADLLEGGRSRLHLRAAPEDRAEQRLRALPGLASVTRRPDGELVVEPGEVPPAAINRALLDGGCEVSELRGERLTLQAAFEALVDTAGVQVPP